MHAYIKPEAALRRSQEMIASNQPEDALVILRNTVVNRKFRAFSETSIQEDVMTSFVRLCVDLNQVKIAREGLHNYRTFTQHSNTVSLGKVLVEFRSHVEANLRAASEKFKATSGAKEVEGDVEAEMSPETLMIAALQVDAPPDAGKDLQTAMRLALEVYKLVLELIRTVPKLEKVYHETARRALDFCCSYSRPLEFRRISDLLRHHYNHLTRPMKPPSGRPDRQPHEMEQLLQPELHIETRIKQLETATSLNLWRAAFETVEEIFNLGIVELSQKYAVVGARGDVTQQLTRSMILQSLATYYEKIAQIFFMSKNPLFHGLARVKFLIHSKRKALKDDERVRLADTTVIALLIIPLESSNSKSDSTSMGALAGSSSADTAGGDIKKSTDYVNKISQNKRFGQLLGHSKALTRKYLQDVLVARGILEAASPAVQKIYDLVEAPRVSLKLCHKLEPLLEGLKGYSYYESCLQAYVDLLKAIVVHKLLNQLNSIYTSVRFDYLADHLGIVRLMPWPRVERIMVNLATQGAVTVSLDYAKRLVNFGVGATDSHAKVHDSLKSVGKNLERTISSIPQFDPILQHRKQFYANIQTRMALEQERHKERYALIQQQRQALEEQHKQQEEARVRAEREKTKREEEEEAQRRAAGQQKVEEMRRKEDMEKVRAQVAKMLLAEIKKVFSEFSSKGIVINNKPLDKITPEDLCNKAIVNADVARCQEEYRNRERQEKIRMRRREARKVDYNIRAIREHEAKKVQENIDAAKGSYASENEQYANKFLEKHYAAWKSQQEERELFVVGKDFVESWKNHLFAKREASCREMQEEQKKRLMETLKAQKINRAVQRKQEAIRLQQEQEEREKQEELERKKKEEAERKAAEEEVKNRERERAEKMKREREAEIEAKLEEGRQKARDKDFARRPMVPPRRRSDSASETNYEPRYTMKNRRPPRPDNESGGPPRRATFDRNSDRGRFGRENTANEDDGLTFARGTALGGTGDRRRPPADEKGGLPPRRPPPRHNGGDDDNNTWSRSGRGPAQGGSRPQQAYADGASMDRRPNMKARENMEPTTRPPKPQPNAEGWTSVTQKKKKGFM